MTTEKSIAPAYTSYKSLTGFFNARRDDGHVTDKVDRSLMSSYSGSTANELLAALRFLGMINEKGEPTALYRQYVEASDADRKSLMNEALREAYAFVFSNPGYNVERATTATTADLFRAQGVNGSTLARAIAFFLAAAKDVGIKVSPNIKIPAISKSGRSAKPKKETPAAATRTDDDEADDLPPVGYQVFEMPIPINRKVRITLPADWAADDWDLLKTLLNVYVDGWKQQSAKARSKDKGPDPETGPAP